MMQFISMSLAVLVISPTLLFLVVLLCASYAKSTYKYLWNRGVCRENGLPWVLSETLEDGTSIYTAGEQSLWL